ncbi:MAG: transglutaminase family protein [Labilithrix sp.]|nr:transglutaminase family protein [Labilithrix sp.]MCW5815833.1 transglutaminase family protein [Labilithrix sp.]
MSIHVALHHRTSYRYDRSVSLGPQSVRLRPAPHCRTKVLAYSLKVTPAKHFINWQQDPQSNYIARLVFPEKTTALEIEVDLVAEMAAYNPFDFFVEPYAEKWPFEYDPQLKVDLAPYLRVGESTPLLAELVASVSREPRTLIDVLVELNQRLCNTIKYLVRLEPGLQTPEETLAKRSGSCRDTGWLLVQVFRRLGLAARFASGYLIQLVADTKPLEGPEGPSSDFCDLHAWCEVYVPGAGWIGLDPTSGLLAGEGHLPLACSAEPSLAAPISGALEACETTFTHEMSVTRVREEPRVTKPYTEEAWGAIAELGRSVDAALGAGDVRLTMGGEPTFVSADDFEGAEWNTAALGPTKKKLAAELFHRLRDEYGPSGLVHFGQGKWYPGEPLPRWSLDLYWRNDGEPLWSDRALIADETKPDTQVASPANAEKLLRSVAKNLGLDPKFVFPAYEDAYYYAWRERRLPINVDPAASKLTDPLERERLRRLFTEGLEEASGAVLPVGKDPLEAAAAKAARAKGGAGEAARWRTSRWHFRGEHCFLAPGDSPLGLRLPLDATPWIDPKDLVPPSPKDPSDEAEPLAERAKKPGVADERAPEAGKSAPWVLKTAMCVEPRDGVLRVFMPPLEALDDWVELVGAIEAAAKEHALPILFEGYPPPRDERLGRLSVTPDPGVIEVNIHPSGSWDELVHRTTHLYEAARQTRLAAEKFMIDGRHAGTGGGNHVVLGGATPNDSPFLRRPDLLRSMVAYFHQHPSLSFLFSGMFIGPTSQSPRIDEARNDSLFEIEIAFAELDRRAAKGEDVPPWLVDRLFRDLLVDLTGNTHRAEFCIDKLYSPDGATGRLGLVELRALEMPPHPRMSLVQQLLLRALLATFWKEPFAPARLTRWGTELHDRFMLPFWVWQDFEDVIADLRRAGFAFDATWFAPHFEFRFPLIGAIETRAMKLTLRSALEPWHVMGEDASAGGTARYVDSSLERVEARVTGWNPERFVLTCNGVEVPLQPTGKAGDLVAGVRFRAWQPPRCLHPHIAVHAPLVFDVVDRWNERSLGGCEYHVAHPGGRSHETRPVNALEAEGRRRARFFETGHTPRQRIVTQAAPPSPEFPFTLDLRRAAPSR